VSLTRTNEHGDLLSVGLDLTNETGRYLRLGVQDDEGRQSIGVDLDVVIGLLVSAGLVEAKARASTPYTPPRYDEVFAAGLTALDEAE
jgi:hypothetical protein